MYIRPSVPVPEGRLYIGLVDHLLYSRRPSGTGTKCPSTNCPFDQLPPHRRGYLFHVCGYYKTTLILHFDTLLWTGYINCSTYVQKSGPTDMCHMTLYMLEKTSNMDFQQKIDIISWSHLFHVCGYYYSALILHFDILLSSDNRTHSIFVHESGPADTCHMTFYMLEKMGNKDVQQKVYQISNSLIGCANCTFILQYWLSSHFSCQWQDSNP
jgi:hypothetical protein